tara:strand:- start:585 stop:869 length:285 start_codon:yes stop_codon:yes gene_type:complete
MSQRLKINDSSVLNVEEIIYYKTKNADSLVFFTSQTVMDASGLPTTCFELSAGTGKADNLKDAIDKAISGSPSGRVIKVPAGDYTAGSLTFKWS